MGNKWTVRVIDHCHKFQLLHLKKSDWSSNMKKHRPAQVIPSLLDERGHLGEMLLNVGLVLSKGFPACCPQHPLQLLITTGLWTHTKFATAKTQIVRESQMLLAQHFNLWAEKAEILASVMETGHTSGGDSSWVNHCSHDHRNNSSAVESCSLQQGTTSLQCMKLDKLEL